MPTVCAPAIEVPGYQVTTRELLETLADFYRGHPRLKVVLRVIAATTVRSRRYCHPLAEVLSSELSLGDRLRRHNEDAVTLAEAAAHDALLQAGISAQDIDCLVVSSHSGHTMPGIDVALQARLGLPAGIRRVPVTQLGCAGGAWSIAFAAELMLARPWGNALVVCADVFSSGLHPDDTDMDGMIFKGLIGDAAGACVVRGDAEPLGMVMRESWEYIVPGTRSVVGSRLEADGVHGHNKVALLEAVESAMPHLNKWLQDTCPPGGDAAPEFVVSHCGSPRILDGIVEGLSVDPSLVRLSRESLGEIGNVGGASVLDVLSRTFDSPPEDGAQGLLLAVGPGVAVVASRIEWRDGAAVPTGVR